MKNRITHKQNIQLSSSIQQINYHDTKKFNIKFDLTQSNISCFIDPYKKTHRTSYNNNKNKKISIQTNTKTDIKQLSLHENTKRLQQSPDILKEVSNSILNKIQNKGITCQWQENQQTHDVQIDNESLLWTAFSSQTNQPLLQKSFASTIDCQHSFTSEDLNTQTSMYHHNHQNQFSYHDFRLQYFRENIFEVIIDQIGYDVRTTIMIRNIPNKYTILQFSQQIDHWFRDCYDFLYLPCDLKNQCNVGYGFINFTDTKYLKEFYLHFHGHKWAKFRSQKICNLTYARLQGLNSLIEHFENSKILNQKQKRYRPIIKKPYSQGNQKLSNLIKTQKNKYQQKK